MVNHNIFRQYDIRGVWGRDLTEEAVRAVGDAFAVYLRERLKGRLPEGPVTVSVGMDARKSSPAMARVLTEALLRSGMDVIDLGMCPTPLQYFSLFRLPVQGGIMVTGSHNPPEFNGMKLSVGRETLFGEMIQEIRALADRGARVEGARPGRRREHDIISEYKGFVAGGFGRLDGLKVVVDAGNGTGGLAGPDIMRDLGAEVVELYCEPDGDFPNHHPDPVVLENVRELMERVRAEKAHVGIGYDGDADRIGVVDEDGDVVWGDRLMIIFAREILREKPGATVIGEVKCSQTLYDDVRARGGNPVMWKTGHSLIKNKMKESGALLAGEMSGHIFFADRYFGYDDAVYASLRLLEILARSGRPYSVKRLLEGVPETFSTPEIRVDCPDDRKFDVVERVKGSFEGYPVIDIDGVRVNFPDGWGLIRASNTQPALVLRFEATSPEALDRIRSFVEGELKKRM
ncbi:MAG: phosphomannomutase/phosphoglucomutase [Thermodesulfovibrionales bacterium]